jgi:hypothetical protein
LLNGVTDVLAGEVVLEFEGGHRQAVDEQGQIEGAAGLVAAVGELAGEELPACGTSTLICTASATAGWVAYRTPCSCTRSTQNLRS